MDQLQQINANWVAIIPFAFTPQNSTKVYFNNTHQWWGEKSEGTKKLIQIAQQKGLKIMLKPHVWHHHKWIGDFSLYTPKEWQIWEQEYSKYLLHYAKIAQQYQVELLCIGTELKKVVINRPMFFNQLIPKVKKIYKGKLTYAANWNSLQEVPFWSSLDYIGVDAYFPLSTEKQPSVATLNQAWNPIKKQLKIVSQQHKKPILFTEYGFESTDYNTKTTWGNNGKHPANTQAQANAYTSYFQSFYKESWFAGGFFWKWHLTPKTLRNPEKSFTPQNKLAQKVIQKYFK